MSITHWLVDWLEPLRISLTYADVAADLDTRSGTRDEAEGGALR